MVLTVSVNPSTHKVSTVFLGSPKTGAASLQQGSPTNHVGQQAAPIRR
jgi:hypothetical protein